MKKNYRHATFPLASDGSLDLKIHSDGNVIDTYNLDELSVSMLINDLKIAQLRMNGMDTDKAAEKVDEELDQK